MEKSPTNLSSEALVFLIAVVVIACLLSPYLLDIQNFKNYILSLNLWFYPIVLGIFIVLGILSYLLYLFVKIIVRVLILAYKKIHHKIAHRHDEARYKQIEAIETENLLSKVFTIDEQILTNDIEELRDKLSICRQYKELAHFIPQLKKRLATAGKLLEELQKKIIIEELNKKTEKAKMELEEIKRQKEMDTEREHDRIERDLKMHENNVYKKNRLTKKQVEILKENGYKQINEYCVYERKFITILIKTNSFMSHSPTHEFLVWSAKRLLERTQGISKIEDHLTKNADITFKYKNKKYALEIELGSLLRKKKQSQAKVKYLNDNFKDKWMFIVSNKNLLQDYRKLGFCTPRNRVCENLQKLLKSEHPLLVGVRPVMSTKRRGIWYESLAPY